MFTTDDYYSNTELLGKILKKKEPYVFTITSVNSAGESLTSTLTTDTLPLISPVISSFTATATQTTDVNINTVIDNGGSSLNSMNISVTGTVLSIDLTKTSSSNTTGLNYSNLVITQSTSNSSISTYTFTLKGLNSNSGYAINLSVTNGVTGLNSPVTATSSVTTPTTPGAPSISKVTSGVKQCIIEFRPPVSNGRSTITQYTVKSTPGNITATGTTSPITITGLTNGTSYTFTVKATNSVGTGSESAPSNSVLVAGVPSPPTVVRATSNENKQSTITFSGQDANGSPITSYIVTSTPGNITATGTTSPITITGLTNGIKYIFTVKAINNIGESINSIQSNEIVAATVADKIANVTTTADNIKNIILNFTVPNDNGSGINSYTVRGYYTDEQGNIYYEELKNLSGTSRTPNTTSTITLNTTGDRTKKYIGNVNDVLDTTKNKTQITSNLSLIPVNQQSSSSPPPSTGGGYVVPQLTLGYARVPLKGYPIGKERNTQKSQNCYWMYGVAVLICLFIFFMYRNQINKSN
jgi:hypothetical protein